MIFHVVALPHTQVNGSFPACAFNEKVRKFCIMLHELGGHELYLYAGDRSSAPCTEAIACITEAERVACLDGRHYTEASFDNRDPHWVKFNDTVVAEMAKRIGPRDFICVIGGLAHKPVADAFPNHMVVEFGIGYPGTFAPYRVFESYAWMHSIYAVLGFSPDLTTQPDGRFFDDVIPSYFEAEKFPWSEETEDYYLFIARLNARKGLEIAQETCQKMRARLIVAGPGDFYGYGEYVGVIDHEIRGQLMSKAVALFSPTIYIEPFGSVHVEANLCGTPVITTDWGVYTETVTNGFNGYRCRMAREFTDAAKLCRDLDRAAIRSDAQSKYSLEVIAQRYESYFNRLQTLWDKGFYSI